MNPEDFISILEKGSVEDIHKAKICIMDSKDIDFLKKISEHFDDILKVIVGLQRQQTKEAKERKAAVNSVANLIGEIKRNNCHCSIYSSLSASVQSEESKGFVEILSKEDNPETWDIKYKCKCLLCGKCYAAYDKEAGFGRITSWKRYS